MIELIRQASARLKEVISPTPVVSSSTLSRLFGFDALLKLENLQKTGSFKVRGAYNLVSSLSPEERARGVVTASSGNHGQGVAWASTLLGVKSVIVMPETAPIVKSVATRSYGGTVVARGKSFHESHGYALSIAKEKGMTFIPPYDDYLVMAGQGTIGLEIMEAVPDVDAVVVPVGGGGLISGIASAMKESGHKARVIGVEARAVGSCSGSLKMGHPVEAEGSPTIADGIAVKKVGDKTFEVIRKYVDSVVSVGEDTIAAAILNLLERKKLVVEGAGAVTVAAAMEGSLPGKIRKAVFVLSGGNIDVTTLDRVIRLGLLKEGRVMRLSTVIADVPGSLAALTSVIANLRANILHVVHQREAMEAPVGATKIEVILEVEDRAHGEAVLKGLSEQGYRVAAP